MKNVRKLFTMILVVVMVLSMATTALAAGDTGSITITNATENVAYAIYKVFDLTYSGTNVSYTYTKTGASDALYTALTGTGSPFTLTATATANVYSVSSTANAATISTWLKNNESKLTETQSTVATGATVAFTGVPYGYYYVTSSLGTVITVNSAKPDASITDKNEAPTMTKDVKEGDTWGDTSSADIGDKVEYKVEIVAKKGGTGYILHDTMTEGLSFNNDIVIKVGSTTLKKGTDYTVNTTNADGCTFEVVFAQSYLNTITADTTIVVTYSATLNEKALIADDSNDNTAKLQYGNAVDTDGDNIEDTTPETPKDTTKTYTYKFDLVKTGSDNKLLNNAEFELYAADKTTKIKLIKIDANTYRVAKTGETGVTTIEVADGDVTIQGLDNGTYHLKETKAPAGYNQLSGFTEVIINGANLEATVNNGAYVNGGVKIVNNAGSELPSTGGMGTTMFYVFGTLLTLAAAILLITKKRMSVA